MDSTAWGGLSSNRRTSTFGRPYVEKPSFDGLPSESLEAVQTTVRLAADIAADWDRVESLFESHWFGPCSCLGGVWGRPVVLDPADSLDEPWNVAGFRPHAASVVVAPAQQRIPQNSTFQRQSDPTLTSPLTHPLINGHANGNGQHALVYGAAAAPLPEPAFTTTITTTTTAPPATEPPPQRPVPVPRSRAPGAGAWTEPDDSPLPAALPLQPAAAAPATASEAVPTPPGYGTRGWGAGGPADPAATAAMAPQLGTWANRQYRLLDAVPERGEGGPGSATASAQNSVPSSASNHRSPASSNHRSPENIAGTLLSTSGRTGGGGGGGSGSGNRSLGPDSGGCGSGDYSGGGSSSNAASQGPGASPTLLDILHRQQHHPGHGQVDPAAAFLDNPELLSAAQALQTELRASSESAALALLRQQQQLEEGLAGPEGLVNGEQRQHGAHNHHVHHHQDDNHRQHGAAAAAAAAAAGAAAEAGAVPEASQPGHERRQSAFANLDSEAVQAAAEAMMQEAAWRWRFTRRWQAEQAKTGPEHASSAPPDQLEEALAYLQATNATTTVSMQIAHTGGGGGGRGGGRGGTGGGTNASLEGSLALQSLMGTLGAATSTLGGEWPLGAFGSGSGSFTNGPRILGRQQSGELLAASKEVASLNRRAALVLQQQLDCEQQAERRVQESLGQGSPWVGQYIPIVQIDEWGSFRFLMLKLRDQSARGLAAGAGPSTERQRILIRGHNYGSEGQLMEECNREILSLSHKHNVPFEAPTVMGGGVMEWRRDRDRHLHLHSGFVMDRALPMGAAGLGLAGLGGGNGGRPASAMDLLNLAAALARQSFPPTYKITVLT